LPFEAWSKQGMSSDAMEKARYSSEGARGRPSCEGDSDRVAKREDSTIANGRQNETKERKRKRAAG
jgi:hypothetical protein